MVRTVAKLRILCNNIKMMGYDKQFPENVLFREIMEQFGTEQYIVRDVAKSLRQLGFVRVFATGVWEFCGEFAPKEEKSAKEEIKPEILVSPAPNINICPICGREKENPELNYCDQCELKQREEMIK